ncbi:hypothetical protein [Sagittula salina]|uniref:Antifreeze protein n=1 Tax=Sagittula salina TaxID=2820268 RepID=A0A940S1S7_9RHOB|nr:hypothetical protein [Sagittula salina]MBP0481264.1 hypothetical protein [Sagittula salina]
MMFTDMMKAATDWHLAAFAGGRMVVSAGVVIQTRVAQMAMGVMRPEEFVRMVMEKPAAFASASEMAGRALAANKGYAAAWGAALAPIEASASANARRLSPRSHLMMGLQPRGRRR